MARLIKVSVCVCLAIMLFAGCYSSVIVDPRGDERELMYSDAVKLVVTKDGRTYEFDKPAAVNETTVAGVVKGRLVSIPMASVEKVGVSHHDKALTFAYAVGSCGALSFVLSRGIAMAQSR